MKKIAVILFGGVFLSLVMFFLGIEVSEQPIQYIILFVCAELYGIAIWVVQE